MRFFKLAERFREDWHSRRNKYWVLAAALLAVVLTVLLVGKSSPLREDAEHYLAGEGSYGLAFGVGEQYVQEFRPQYGKLKSVGIVVDMQKTAEREADGQETAEQDGGQAEEQTPGSVRLGIVDGAGLELWSKELLAAELSAGVYTDVDVNLELSAGKTYYLTAESFLVETLSPELVVCSTDYELRENRSLAGREEIAGTQLLTRYRYVDALLPGTAAKALLLVFLAALGIAVGLPADRRIRAAVSVVLLAAGPFVLGRRLELLLPTNVLLPHAMKWNVGLMFLFELIVLLCTLSERFTIVFCNIALTILYCANYFVYAFRGTYLKANEFTAIGTAVDVAGKYRFQPDSHMTMCWCIAAVLVVWGMCTGKPGKVSEQRREPGQSIRIGKLRFSWKGILVHGLGLVLGIALLSGARHVLLDTELLLEHGFSYYSGINSEYTYYFDGYLVGSMLNIRYSRITEPAGYSVRRVEEILSAYREGGQENSEGSQGSVAPDVSQELPHIILIMNESWSDLRVNGNLELSQENLSFTKSLRENTVKGYVNASVLGGGTANSEFEVFTGCAMGFLPDSYYAYQQAVTHPMPSMVSHLQDLGYSTVSMHPERALNWRRNVVYNYLSFERRFWKEDFEGAEVIHSGVSDAETFRKVEELYENRAEGEKLFIFDLTMQNHGYYRKSNVERTVEAVNVDCDEADLYLSLVYETDRAFGELVQYFEKEQEPVVICMFGDHQPKFETEDFYEDIYRQTEGLTEVDKKRNLYKTPFVIWANYDIPEAEGLDISMSYLGVLLQQTAGVEMTPYFRFLAGQMEEYPVVTVNGYVDREGNYSNWSGSGEEFPDYRMLQYNYLFDNNIVEWGY
ncbi:MAG: LTA synthase family protein [Acetatifactor sp.]|nr:LTA synthase family protein [Acetatifactor sp.]